MHGNNPEDFRLAFSFRDYVLLEIIFYLCCYPGIVYYRQDTKTISMKKVYESPDTEEIQIQVENFILGYGELPPSGGDEE